MAIDAMAVVSIPTLSGTPMSSGEVKCCCLFWSFADGVRCSSSVDGASDHESS